MSKSGQKEKSNEESESFPKEMDLLGTLGASDGLVDPNSSREEGEFADSIIRDVGLHIQANIDAEEAEKSLAEKITIEKTTAKVAGDEQETASDKEFGFV